jgi:hypothetical protein
MSPTTKKSTEWKSHDNDANSSASSNLPPLPRLSQGLPPVSFDFQSVDEVSSSSRVSNNGDGMNSTGSWRNSPPRSNWNVPDNKLKPIPPLHPPSIPTQSTYIGDSSPSIIAARISECLKKRSVLAEYDDEDATATVVTPDGCSFLIAMHRGDKGARIELKPRGHDQFDLTGGSTSEAGGSYHTAESIGVVTARPDFTHGVLVECHRIRGDVMTFHYEVRMILRSSRGECDGMEDHRHPLVGLRSSPYGFNGKHGRGRMLTSNLNQKGHQGVDMEWDISPGLIQLGRSSANSIPNSTCTTLERILDLLERDRVDAQCLGMKSLVLLTNVRSAGLERAYMAALCVLGSKMRFPTSGKDSPMQTSAILIRIPDRIKAIIIGKFKTSAKRQEDNGAIDETGGDRLTSPRNPYQPLSVETPAIEAFHNAELRHLALQTITNVLSLVVYHSHEFPLLPKPSCESLLSKEVLEAIAYDLGGATRPPMANLGTAHEATFAARFLHLLAAFSEEGYHRLSGLRVGTPPRPIIELLERGKTAGLACHRALEVEANIACEALNEHK